MQLKEFFSDMITNTDYNIIVIIDNKQIFNHNKYLYWNFNQYNFKRKKKKSISIKINSITQ